MATQSLGFFYYNIIIAFQLDLNYSFIANNIPRLHRLCSKDMHDYLPMQMYKNVNDCFGGLLSAFGKLKYVNVEFRVFFPLIFDKSALDSQLPKKTKQKIVIWQRALFASPYHLSQDMPRCQRASKAEMESIITT